MSALWLLVDSSVMGISKKKKPALAHTKGAPGGRLMKRFIGWLRLLAALQ
jgi:hypothetical protein